MAVPRGVRRRAAFALALVLLSSAACDSSTSPSSAPVAVSERPATPAATPASIPPAPRASTVPPAVPYTDWTELAFPEPTPHVYGGSSVEAAIAFEGGYLAVGQVNGGCCDASFSTDTHGVIWRSSDGRAWSIEPRSKVFDLAHLSDIATDGRTIVISGTRMLDSTYYPGEVDPKGAVWTSDDGRTWTRFTGMPRFTAVVYGAGTFLGVTDEALPDLVWSSVDGRRWSPVSAGKALRPGAINDLVVTPLGISAVGSTDAIGGGAAGVSWRSLDGRTWIRSSDQPSLVGGTMTRVAAAGTSLVASGSGPDAAVVWWSTDGLIWAKVDGSVFGSAPILSVDGLTAGPRGLLAAGTISAESPSFGLWASQDGRAWAKLETPFQDGGPSQLSAIERGDGLIVFGDAYDPLKGRLVPAAWDVR